MIRLINDRLGRNQYPSHEGRGNRSCLFYEEEIEIDLGGSGISGEGSS
jgi:hypothetical protein